MDGLKNFALMLGLVGLFLAGVGVGKIWPAGVEKVKVRRVSEAVRVPLGNSDFEVLPDVFRRLAGATNAELIAELERGLDGALKEERTLLAFALRWVLEDAAGGVDFVLGMIGDDEDKGTGRYDEIFEALLFAWSKQDPMGMSAFVTRLGQQGHPLAEDLREIALEAGAGSREMAVEFFTSLKPGGSAAHSELAREMLEVLAKVDPQMAVTFLEKLSGLQRTNAVRRVAEGWAERDPVAALAWAEKLEGQRDREIGLGTIVRKIAEQDLGMAMEQFGKFRKELLDSSAASAIFFAIGKEGPQDAMRWLHGELDQAGPSATFSMNAIDERIRELLPRSPVALYEFLERLPDGRLKSGISGQILNRPPINLATTSAEFLAGVAELPEGELRSNLLTGGLWQHAIGDLEAVRDAVAGLDGQFKVDAARAVFSAYDAFGSAAEVLDFAAATGIDVSALADAEMGSMGSWKDIASAADFFSEAQDPGKNSLVGEFVHSWAAKSPEEALQWVRERPGENPQLVGRVVRGWLEAEPQAASQWALGLENPAEREASAAAVAKAMRFKDPEASFAWALEVGDRLEREELIRRAYSSWKQRDRAAADAALAGDGVPGELREIFLAK